MEERQLDTSQDEMTKEERFLSMMQIPPFKPKERCPHGKSFYCQQCVDLWPEETRKMMQGISA